MNIETIESLQRILEKEHNVKTPSRAVSDPVEEQEPDMLRVVNFDGSHKLLYADYDHPSDMYNRANNTYPGTLVFCKDDLSLAKRTTISAADCAGDYSKCWDFYFALDDYDIMWHTLEIPE